MYYAWTPLFLFREKGIKMSHNVFGDEIIQAIEYSQSEDRPLKYANFNEESGMLTLIFHDSSLYDDDDIIEETNIRVTVKDEVILYEPIQFKYKESKELLDRIYNIRKQFPEITDRDIAHLIDPNMSVRDYRKMVSKAHIDLWNAERRKVIRLLNDGYSHRLVAEKLGISECKVRHLARQKTPPTIVYCH